VKERLTAIGKHDLPLVTVFPFLVHDSERDVLVRGTRSEHQQAGIRIVFGPNEFV
jgi:hypothetical protein